MKHTPGPWEWRIKKEILVDPKDNEFGFFVGDLKHQTGEKSALLVITTEENRYGQKEIICFSSADKNLIAAAPDLLQALKEALPPEDHSGWWCPTCKCAVPGKEVTFEEYHESCGTYLGNCQPETWVDRARKIIKKAEGK